MKINTKDTKIQVLLTESIDSSKIETSTELTEKLKDLGLKDFIIEENKETQELEILRIFKG